MILLSVAVLFCAISNLVASMRLNELSRRVDDLEEDTAQSPTMPSWDADMSELFRGQP